MVGGEERHLPDALRENLIWVLLVPFGITTVGAVIAVVLTRRWGSPNPFEQKMRHLSKIDKQKALLKAFESVDKNAEAFLFLHLQQFFREFLIGCLMFGVPCLILGVYTVFSIATESPDKPPTAQVFADIIPALIEIFGWCFLLFAVTLIYFGYLAFWHFWVMRRILRFNKYKKPKVLKRLAELERV